jgi:hypothetical protein
VKLPDVQDAVRGALQKLFTEEMTLFQNDSSERSITHWLGVYLIPYFKEPLKVDCEYNRRGYGNKKNLKILAKKLRQWGKANPKLKAKKYGTVFPDIIAHERTEQTNILIIETKKTGNPINHDYDFEKLQLYTTDFAGEPDNLFYTYGLFIEFVAGEKSSTLRDLCKTVVWYSKGNQLVKESADFLKSL